LSNEAFFEGFYIIIQIGICRTNRPRLVLAATCDHSIYGRSGHISLDVLPYFYRREDWNSQMIKLRPYQTDMELATLEATRKGHKRIVVASATGCITGDSIVNLNRAKKGFSMEIAKAHKHMHDSNYRYYWNQNIATYARSFTGKKILLHKISDIVYSGEKEVYNLVLENGFSIKATANHEIMTKNGFIKLIDLNTKNFVMIDENKATRTNKNIILRDKVKSVGKYHPYGVLHKSESRTRVSYTIEIHRAIYEAFTNGFETLEKYLSVVKSGKIDGLEFVDPKIYAIHHIDGDHYNNDFSNLQKLTHSEHLTIHGNYDHFGYGEPSYSRVKNIEYVGLRETYDIICEDPHRNFVANKIVIHNSGKTVIFADIAIRAIRKKRRVLILTHREEIMYGILKTLVRFGENPGIIKGKEIMKASRVHVAMVQTLSRGDRVKFLKSNRINFDLIICDEGHHFTAPQFMEAFDGFSDATVLFFTATPARTDGVGMDQAGATALINGPQYADLLNSKYTGGEIYLCPPVVFFSPDTLELCKATEKLKKNKLGFSDYSPTNETKIFGEKRVINNCVELYRQHFNGAPAIIFGASLDDCHNVASAMIDAGYKGGVVYDKMDSETRKDYIEGLGDGRYNFLCSYDIISEGVDIPVVAGCIIRRRTKSLILYMQMVGRPARRYPGKKYNIIIDQAGVSIIHGHPLTRRKWTLQGVETDESEKLIMTVCPKCAAHIAGRPKNCPYCGEEIGKSGGARIEEINEIYAPMEIMPPPIDEDYNDSVRLMEFEEMDRERELMEEITNGTLTNYQRFTSLAAMMGKDRKWTSRVWRKYYEGD
jgi:DNA repair protein RadD